MTDQAKKIMEEKEAREIISDPTKLNVSMYDYREAKGYLKAIEKADVLEKALRQISQWLSGESIDIGRCESEGRIFSLAQDALCDWMVKK